MGRVYTDYILDQNKLASILYFILKNYRNANNIARLTYLKGGDSYFDEKLYKGTKDYISPVVCDLLDAMDADPSISAKIGYKRYSKSTISKISSINNYNDLCFVFAISLHYVLKVFGEDYICGLTGEQLSLLLDKRLEIFDFDDSAYSEKEFKVLETIVGKPIKPPTAKKQVEMVRLNSKSFIGNKKSVKNTDSIIEDF